MPTFRRSKRSSLGVKLQNISLSTVDTESRQRAGHQNRTGARLDQAVDATEQGRFSRAAQADDADKLTLFDLEIDTPQHLRLFTVGFVEIFDLKDGHGCFFCSASLIGMPAMAKACRTES